MNPPSSLAQHSPRQNDLLAVLPNADYERLSASLELIPLPLGRASVTQDGSSAEIAIAGNEAV
jgi:hypothetical protein